MMLIVQTDRVTKDNVQQNCFYGYDFDPQGRALEPELRRLVDQLIYQQLLWSLILCFEPFSRQKKENHLKGIPLI